MLQAAFLGDQNQRLGAEAAEFKKVISKTEKQHGTLSAHLDSAETEHQSSKLECSALLDKVAELQLKHGSEAEDWRRREHGLQGDMLAMKAEIVVVQQDAERAASALEQSMSMSEMEVLTREKRHEEDSRKIVELERQLESARQFEIRQAGSAAEAQANIEAVEATKVAAEEVGADRFTVHYFRQLIEDRF
jgi:hypothetical protein